MAIVRYAQFVRRLLTSPIPYVIFFVTSRCNNRCKYCFNWKNFDSTVSQNELSTLEIKKIAGAIRDVVYITITGGEPLLRDDIVDICRVFYDNNTRLIALHTNGYLPQKIARVACDIIQACPDLYLDICLSLDGLGRDNDEIRGAADSFNNILESINLIEDVRKQYKNIGLEINTTYSYYTKDHIEDIHTFVTEKLKLSYGFCLVRGCTREKLAHNISLGDYEHFVTRYPAYAAPSNARGYPLFSFTQTIKKMSPALSIKILKEKRQCLPCLAGKKVIVISETGDVFPCESLSGSFGNLREYHYDMKRLLHSERAKEIIHSIEKGNCYCSWECAHPVNLLYTWKGRRLILERWIKELLGFVLYPANVQKAWQ